jgi:hypothetical protein
MNYYGDCPIYDRLCFELNVRTDMRRTLFDDIAAAAIDDIVAGFDLLLMFAAPTDES